MVDKNLSSSKIEEKSVDVETAFSFLSFLKGVGIVELDSTLSNTPDKSSKSPEEKKSKKKDMSAKSKSL